MYRKNGVLHEVIRLKLFPFLVIGDVAKWLNSHSNNHFVLGLLHKEFTNEVFPLTKTLKIRKHVQHFKQCSMESLGEVWRRFKSLKIQCSEDLLHPWDVISSFYGSLNNNSKMLLDSSSNGVFVSSLSDMPKHWLKESRPIPHFGITSVIIRPRCMRSWIEWWVMQRWRLWVMKSSCCKPWLKRWGSNPNLTWPWLSIVICTEVPIELWSAHLLLVRVLSKWMP